MKTGVKFDDVHTYDRWGLRLKKIRIGTPAPKKVLIPIPGGNGVLDVSKSLTGSMTYETRLLEFIFDAKNCRYDDWPTLMSDILGELHGERKKIVLDIDQSFYYDGLIDVKSEKSNEATAEVVIEAECQPFKLELSSSLEDWLWDSFDFETGIIREYTDIRVDGSLRFVIEGRKKPVVPVFTVRSDAGTGLKVRFDGKSYDLPDGITRILSIITKEGVNNLDFTGNGVLEIDYRGGML